MKKIYKTVILLIIFVTLTIVFSACIDENNTDTDIDTDVEFSLTVNFQGTSKGNKIYYSVGNDVAEFSFIDAFEYPSGYRWELHWDKACVPSLNIVSKSVNLEEGDNVLYAIFINNNDETDIHLYEIIIHRTKNVVVTVLDKVSSPMNYSCLEGTQVGDLNIHIPNYSDRTYVEMTIDGDVIDDDYIISNDCTIMLEYELKTYEVVFVDYDNKVLWSTTCQHGKMVSYKGDTVKDYYIDTIESATNKLQVIENGKEFKLQQIGKCDTYEFDKWDAQYDNVITKNTKIKAQYRFKYYLNYRVVHHKIGSGVGIVYTDCDVDSITLDQTEMSGIQIGSYYTLGYEKLGINKVTRIVNIKSNSYSSIGSYAFLANSYGVINPEAITELESLLEKINLPTSIVSIASHAFYNCTSLKEIHYDGTVAQWKKINLGYMWNENSAIEKIICRNGVIHI